MASAQSRESAGHSQTILLNALAINFCDALCGRDSVACGSKLFVSGMGLVGNMVRRAPILGRRVEYADVDARALVRRARTSICWWRVRRRGRRWPRRVRRRLGDTCGAEGVRLCLRQDLAEFPANFPIRFRASRA